MDVTEKILKLGALGWDGKEPELDFFERVYGIRVETIQNGDMIEIILSCKGRNTIRVKIKKRKKIDLVRYCLRLFRTNDGIPEGPSSYLFLHNGSEEWT